tara:strand:+ start:1631 stop:2644 length:1014 start_codon:yes stop_codon:yes gene_type:complete
MIVYDDCLNKRTKYTDILERASLCQMDVACDISQANKILHNLKFTHFNKFVRDKLSLLTTTINFWEICKDINNIENIQDLLTCYYKDNKRHLQEEFLCEKIQNDCIHKKIIFLNINAINYCLDRKEEGNYANHGTCSILIPKNNEYHLYYMNPHGDVIKPYTYFEEYITRKRCKKYDFGKNTVDFVVMNTIVEYCNNYLDTNIIYTMDEAHNYYGVNLQEHDYHGLCFIFPSIIYYYFAKYFTEKRELCIKSKIKYLPSFQDMLHNGNFNLAIHSCFIDFNKHYKKVIFDSIDNPLNETIDKLEKCLFKYGKPFVKNLSSTMINFIYKHYLLKNKII